MRQILVILLLTIAGSSLAGCTSKTPVMEQKVDAEIVTGSWQVEDINQAGIIDSTMITITFSESGRIKGYTGCNQYTGQVITKQSAFTTSQIASTYRGCAPAIAKQEQRFLSALNDAKSYKIGSENQLVIYDASHQPILKLVKMESPDS